MTANFICGVLPPISNMPFEVFAKCKPHEGRELPTDLVPMPNPEVSSLFVICAHFQTVTVAVMSVIDQQQVLRQGKGGRS